MVSLHVDRVEVGGLRMDDAQAIKTNIPPVEYQTVIAALRGAADKYGDGAWRELCFAIPKDKWGDVAKFLKDHSKDELLEVLLCRCAEAR